GCTGGHFYLTTWIAQSDVFATSHPQYFYATTNKAPWTVPLPPCFWQADFAKLTAAPPAGERLEFVAGKLGGSVCPTTTTSTSTTVPVTTTTTVPVTTTTTVPV